MGLVNDKADHIPRQQEPLNGGRAQGFRGDVQNGGKAAGDPLHGLGPLDGAEQAVDGHRIGNAPLGQVVHLVLHQRLQGGDDHGQSTGCLAGHEGGELKGDGLAAAGGEHRQQGFSLHSGPCGVFLEGLAVVGAEGVEAEDVLQLLAHIQLPAAVGTAIGAGRTTQEPDHIVDPGVVAQDPGGRHAVAVVGVDQGQGVGQLDGDLADQKLQGRIGAELSLEEILHGQDRVRSRPLAHQTEEAVELRCVAKKGAVDAAKPRRKGPVGTVLIEKQLAGLHGIVEGIVQGAGLELVVLHQGVIGPHGKEQRRQAEGVDGQILGREGPVDIAQIVGDDVVSADKGVSFGERRQGRGRCRMQLHPIRTHGTDVQDLPGLRLDLRIKKQDFLHLIPSFPQN